MNTKIESIEDLLFADLDKIAKESFKEFSITNEGFLNEKEFHAFLKNFFNDDISLYNELLTSEFYNTSNKSGSINGINFNDFREVFKDCHLMKNHKEVGNDYEGLDVKFETDDLF